MEPTPPEPAPGVRTFSSRRPPHVSPCSEPPPGLPCTRSRPGPTRAGAIRTPARPPLSGKAADGTAAFRCMNCPGTQIIERTRHRHTDVQQLVATCWTISATARRLNLDRNTVRRFRDTDLDQLLASAHERRSAGVLEPFKPYLNTRLTESQGQVSGSRLFLEIQERGYRGSRQVVRKRLAALRVGNAEPVRADIHSPRRITG